MLRIGLSFLFTLLVRSIGVFVGVETVVSNEQGQTAAHLELRFDQVNISSQLFTCSDQHHSSYNANRRTCLLRLSVCPVVPELDAAILSDRSLRRCLQRAAAGSSRKRNSKLFEVSPGDGITLSHSDLGDKTLSLSLGQSFTYYMKWRMMNVALLFQGIADVDDPSRDVPIAEFVLPLPSGNGKLIDRLQLEPRLQRAENVLKNVNNDSLFRLANVSFRVATSCSPGFFPEGECTVYTGCHVNVSSCMRCDPVTGAYLCDQCGLQAPTACRRQTSGNWSDWSGWSDCPAECGWSLTTKHRQCNSPPPVGDKSGCSGNAVRLKLCRKKTCEAPGGLHQAHQQQADRLTKYRQQPWHYNPKEDHDRRPQRGSHFSTRAEGHRSTMFHMSLATKISFLQDEVEHQRKHLRDELRFWTRICMSASLGSLVLTVVWICCSVCQRKPSDPQPTERAPSRKVLSRTAKGAKDKEKLLEDSDNETWGAEVNVQL